MAEIVEKPKSTSDTARDIARRFFRQENAVLLIVLIALIAGMSAFTHGLTTTRTNLMNVVLQSSMRGIAGIGQAFVILTAGIDVSIGGVGLFCSILGASMTTEAEWLNLIGYPMSPFLAIPIMLLVGIAWGAINGSLVSRVSIPALVVTLGMWQIATGAAYIVSRGRNMSFQPESWAFFGKGVIAGLQVPVIIFIVVAVVAYFVLTHTTFGKAVYATGGNPVMAWLSGIKVKNILFSVFVISGFLVALAAVIFTGRVMSASMSSMLGLEIDSIAAATVGGVSLMGGKGSIIGVVLGALILGVVNNTMGIIGASPATMGIVKGAIIFTAVAVDYIRRRG